MKKSVLTLTVILLSVMFPPVSPACTGRDPYFTATPKIEQVGDVLQITDMLRFQVFKEHRKVN